MGELRAPMVLRPGHPYIQVILEEQRRQLLWRWPMLEDRLPCANTLHYGDQGGGLHIPFCGGPIPPKGIGKSGRADSRAPLVDTRRDGNMG